MAIERLLDLQQAAEILGIPHRTLQVKYACWEMPYFRLGRAIRFRESELAQWIESRRETV